MTPPRTLRSIALAVLALAELACKPACEDAGLRSASAAFEAHTLDGRQEGFELLGQACPTLPPTLARSLLAEFDVIQVDQRVAIDADRPRDPAWRELFDRTCPRNPAELEQAMAAKDRERATRTSCKLDRYELLTPEDVFTYRDLTAFMLYEWLLSGRVDRALARDVVWPLLSASASAEALEAMCLVEGEACRQVVATWGIELPRSSMDAPLQGGARILVTPSQLVVERAPVLSLHVGRPAPDAFVHHVSPALRERLQTHADEGRASARAEGREWEPRVTIMADRATPFGTLAPTFFTAIKAGLREAELVVFDGDQLRALTVSPPLAWLPREPEGDRRHREGPLDLTFAVHRDLVEVSGSSTGPKTIPNLGTCEPPPSGCHDLGAITAFARQTKMLHHHETVATFRVDDDVPLQALVSVVDAVRGGGECRLLHALRGEQVPEECLFWQPIIDAEPPLSFRVDQLGTFTLGDATVERTKHHVSGGPSNEALLAAYATAREDIQRCLVARPELLAMLDDEDDFAVLYGRAPDDPRRTTARVFLDGLLDGEPERCMLSALGAEPDRRERATDFLMAMQADLVISTRFGPTTSPEGGASPP